MSRILSFLFLFALISFLLISCSQDATGPTVYERIVIDTYGPFGTGDPKTDLVLYDDIGTPQVTDDDAGPGQIDTYASGKSLSPGTYYIKVYNKDRDETSISGYVVRVLSLDINIAIPDPELPLPDLVTPDPYEDDDNAPGNIPTNPVDIFLGNSNWVNRYLGSTNPVVDPVDDDWLKLVLP